MLNHRKVVTLLKVLTICILFPISYLASWYWPWVQWERPLVTQQMLLHRLVRVNYMFTCCDPDVYHVCAMHSSTMQLIIIYRVSCIHIPWMPYEFMFNQLNLLFGNNTRNCIRRLIQNNIKYIALVDSMGFVNHLFVWQVTFLFF